MNIVMLNGIECETNSVGTLNTIQLVHCEQCGSENIEQQGCHYICLDCGNQEGCSD